MFVHCFLRFSVLPAVNNDNCVSTLLLPLLHLPDKIHNPNSRVRQSRVWPINILELSHCARFLKLNANQSINQSLNLSVSQSFRPSVCPSIRPRQFDFPCKGSTCLDRPEYCLVRLYCEKQMM